MSKRNISHSYTKHVILQVRARMIFLKDEKLLIFLISFFFLRGDYSTINLDFVCFQIHWFRCIS